MINFRKSHYLTLNKILFLEVLELQFDRENELNVIEHTHWTFNRTDVKIQQI
jgi:hypothetical protein